MLASTLKDCHYLFSHNLSAAANQLFFLYHNLKLIYTCSLHNFLTKQLSSDLIILNLKVKIMKKIYTAIGLMSGTSMDGVDVALIKTDGESVFDLKDMPTSFYPYNREDRAIISETIKVATTPPTPEWISQMKRCTDLVTDVHIMAVRQLLRTHRLDAKEIDLIGFHGQTVLHKPEQHITIQLGDGKRLAKETGIDVIHNFRTNDVEQGGQGAPLVPVFHQALAKAAEISGNCVIVNIGGVANLTFISPHSDHLIAFDTGPGNALMDDLTLLHTGKTFDKDGLFAQKGKINKKCLKHYLAHDFFKQDGAKSLDRNAFSLRPLTDKDIEFEDGMATLCAFTAQSIADAAKLLPQPAQNWIITGGGTKNSFLMAQLDALIDGKVSTAEHFGWSSDFMEAQAFGFLAVLHVLGKPQTFPDTTGIYEPMTGGQWTQA